MRERRWSFFWILLNRSRRKPPNRISDSFGADSSSSASVWSPRLPCFSLRSGHLNHSDSADLGQIACYFHCPPARPGECKSLQKNPAHHQRAGSKIPKKYLRFSILAKSLKLTCVKLAKSLKNICVFPYLAKNCPAVQ